MSVTMQDGGRLELVGQHSLRELTLAVDLTVELEAADMEAGEVCGAVELTLARDQVLALRDELTTWLARGEL